jgi:hypothetical protein
VGRIGRDHRREARPGPAARGWLLDMDLAASQARYATEAFEGDRVPGAADHVLSAGLLGRRRQAA